MAAARAFSGRIPTSGALIGKLGNCQGGIAAFNAETLLSIRPWARWGQSELIGNGVATKIRIMQGRAFICFGTRVRLLHSGGGVVESVLNIHSSPSDSTTSAPFSGLGRPRGAHTQTVQVANDSHSAQSLQPHLRSSLDALSIATASLYSEIFPNAPPLSPTTRSTLSLAVVGADERLRADIVAALLLSEEELRSDSWNHTDLLRLLVSSNSSSPNSSSSAFSQPPSLIRYGDTSSADPSGTSLLLPAPLLRDYPLNILLFPDSVADSSLQLDVLFDQADVVVLVTDPLRGVKSGLEKIIVQEAYKRMISPPSLVITLSLPPSIPLPSLQTTIAAISCDVKAIADSVGKEVGEGKVFAVDIERGVRAYANLRSAILRNAVVPTSFQNELAASGIGSLRAHLLTSHLVGPALSTTLAVSHLSHLSYHLSAISTSLSSSSLSITAADSSFVARCDAYRRIVDHLHTEVEQGEHVEASHEALRAGQDVERVLRRVTAFGIMAGADVVNLAAAAVQGGARGVEVAYAHALGRISSLSPHLPTLFLAFPSPSSASTTTYAEYLTDSRGVLAVAEAEGRTRADKDAIRSVVRDAEVDIREISGGAGGWAESGAYVTGGGIFLSFAIPALGFTHFQLPLTLAVLSTVAGTMGSFAALQVWWAAVRLRVVRRVEKRLEILGGDVKSSFAAEYQRVATQPLDRVVEAYERAFSRRWAVLESRRSRVREIRRGIDLWKVEAESIRKGSKF
ncbi:hypothetical protein HDU93_007624 [Gonapodya sp. JEL0774]|nr:hypothetical protein HDU93_007624 [Gonapodya sp. JEL0774]